eukprot:scaffold212124_cov27-Tisochrysis_lutea.AAC.1
MAGKESSEEKGKKEGGEGQRTGSILELKRANLGASAFGNNVLCILHIILSITKITCDLGRRNDVMPHGLLNFIHLHEQLSGNTEA